MKVLWQIPAEDQDDATSKGGDSRPSYRADEFVQDAFDVRITPFMLDNFAAEWAEIRRVANAHAVELDNLRTANRAMAAQMCVDCDGSRESRRMTDFLLILGWQA